MAWNSKIVGHGKEQPDQLLANPFNFRIHGSYQQKVLEANIDQVGFIRSVTVNQRTGHVIDGHLRIILALRRSEPEIDVEYVDLSPDEELLALVTLDPIAALAGKDNAKLDETLRGLTVTNPVLTSFVGKLAGQAGLYQTVDTIPSDETGERSEKETEGAPTEPAASPPAKPTRYFTISIPFTSAEGMREGFELLTLGRCVLEEDAAYAQITPGHIGEDNRTLLDIWRDLLGEVSNA